MAKKANSDQPQRAQKTTADDLRKIATRLQNAAAQIDAQAERMDQECIDHVLIEGRQGVEGPSGAFDKLSKLLASCHRHIPAF